MPWRCRATDLDGEQPRALGRPLLQRPPEHGFRCAVATCKRRARALGGSAVKSAGRCSSGASWADGGSRSRSPIATPSNVPSRASRLESTRPGLRAMKRQAPRGTDRLCQRVGSGRARHILALPGAQASDANCPTAIRPGAHLGDRRLPGTSCTRRLHKNNTARERRIEFLIALCSHPQRALSNIWEGSKGHRSTVVRQCLHSTVGDIAMTCVPLCAPDLKPVGYLQDGLKRDMLFNFRAAKLDHYNATARARFSCARRWPLITATCWVQASLW